MKTTKTLDMCGKTLRVGDRVAYVSFHNLGLTIGIVKKLAHVRAEVVPESVEAWSTKSESIELISLIRI